MNAVRLDDLITRQARRSPDAIAVRAHDGELTYAELIAAAESLAGRLRAAGVGPDDVVGVCADRSVRLPVALLGILRASGAYLPLDPTFPELRLRHITGEARPRVLLGDENGMAVLSGLGVPVLAMDGGGGAVREPSVESRADGLAYVIYTSGSTGAPKGVAIEHRAIVNRLLWMQETYRLEVGDVVLQKTPYTFDVSVWEFFWPLMTGATMLLAAPGSHRDPESLVSLIQSESVTTVHFVPSMLAPMLDQPGFKRCTSLRRVFCSGEALPPAIANRFTRLGLSPLYNLYGPTEAAVDVTHWTCRPVENGAAVPIGHAITNVQTFVLDDEARPVPDGDIGELYLAGACLARGYVGRADLTADRFVAVPAVGVDRAYRTGDLVRRAKEGHLEYCGRNDHQVKIRGNRVELGEIEAVLLGHPRVQDAAVLARTDLGPVAKLVGYVFVAPGVEPPERDELADLLTMRLPDFMIPPYLVTLREKPLTSSGKLDRTALPRPAKADLLPSVHASR